MPAVSIATLERTEARRRVKITLAFVIGMLVGIGLYDCVLIFARWQGNF